MNQQLEAAGNSDQRRLRSTLQTDPQLAKRRMSAAKRDLLQVHQLIDLTDKPIHLTRADIGWSRVRASSSNCICCCARGSITLVTTNDSYMLDHIPLDDIQVAQANANLTHLAMSNRRKIAIIDLVESNISLGPQAPPSSRSSSSASSSGSCSSGLSSCTTTSSSHANKLTNSNSSCLTKVVNLAAKGLSMHEVLLWRWLDDSTLGILTRDALFVCPIEQTRINHPAASALTRSSQLLAIERVCDLHPNLSRFCQITNIQRDDSGQLYAITGLYSPSSLSLQPTPANNRRQGPTASLKHSFSSVPGRLSQLAGNEHSFESLPSIKANAKCADLNQNHILENGVNQSEDPPPLCDEICGLVQIHCKIRDCSQLIRAQAASFVTCQRPSAYGSPCSTTLIAANRAHDKLRIHFIGMATSNDLTTNGQSASPSTRFNDLDTTKDRKLFDLPTSIVCSHLPKNPRHAPEDEDGDSLHVAMVTTKYGQLVVCSVQFGTILFNVRITHDVISSTVLESKTNGLMVVCRNGQVLLVQLSANKVARLLEESRSLRPVPSYDLLDCGDRHALQQQACTYRFECAADHQVTLKSATTTDKRVSLDLGLDVLESTKL